MRVRSPVRRFLIATLFLALAWSAGAVQAAERIAVRVGEHDGYGRMVFDWPSAPSYQARIEEGHLILEFERPAAFDLSRLRELEDYLVPPNSGSETKRLRLKLRGDFSLKHFPLDGRIVVDLLTAAGAAQQNSDSATAPPGGTQEATATAAQPKPAEEPPAGAGAAAAAPPASAAKAETEAQEAAPTAAPAQAETKAEPQPAASALNSPLQLLAPQLMDAVQQVEVPEAERSRAPADSPGTTGRVPTETGVDPLSLLQQLSTTVPVEVLRSGLEISLIETDGAAPDTSLTTPYFQPVRLRFDWQQEVPLAAFQRGQEVWLAFKAVAPPESAEIVKELVPSLISAERLDPPQGTVFRLEVPPLIEARVTASGDDWLLDLRHQAEPLSARIPVRPMGEGAESGLAIALKGAKKPILLDDLERGGQVALIASARPGQALSQARSYPGLSLLATLQGVVVQIDDSSVEIESGSAGVMIRRRGGLLSLPATDTAQLEKSAAQATEARLFDLPSWRRGRDEDFERTERQLQSRIGSGEPSERLVARVELAKFYFAYGFTDESLGVLQLLESESQDAMLDPELLLLTAAGHILRKDYQKGAVLLGHPSLSGEPEARLWEGQLAAERDDWPLAAYRFDETFRLIEDYFPPIRTRLYLSAAEAAAAVGDRGEAMRLLKRASEEELTALEGAAHDYVLGRILLADGREQEARELLGRVAGGRHGYPSVKARLALIDLNLAQERLSTEQGITRLEQLRYAWRGDAFEFALLRRIADMNESIGRYRETLRTLRSAAAHFPHLPEHDAIGERMSKLFRELFLSDRAEELPPLAALTIYEEFRELSPGGEEGSRLVSHLADRLVEVDLLGRATELLEEQVTFRLSGLDKARVGARLAMIYLLDRRPREALAALERSDADRELPLGLDRQRVYLRAQALLRLDRGFEALALIEDDISEEAERLRVEILWELREWDAAAEIIARNLPAPDDQPAVTEALSGEVLSLAVALTLGDRNEELAALQQDWAGLMAKGPHAESFALLSGDLSSGQVSSIARELAKVKQAQAFMTNYRDSFGRQGEDTKL